MYNRLPDIKDACHARVYGPAVGDVNWLLAEVERLRSQLESIRHSLVASLHRVVFTSDSTFDLLASVLHQRHGAMTELNDIHDILAEALGYRQDALDDPDSPCPGAWVTGDRTAASLALEAAKVLKDESQKRLDNAVNQIVELQHELTEVRDTKKGRLRRELAARKEHCCCVFQDEGIDESRLLPHPDCREHGIEANDRRLAGEKALSTLHYVRKYFMGSDHGHEV
jgi:hypothetical protein